MKTKYFALLGLLLLLANLFACASPAAVTSSVPTQTPWVVTATPEIQTSLVSTPSIDGRIDYTQYDKSYWFPPTISEYPELSGGAVGDVTNEKASWGNQDTLNLFEEWGRQFSYEKWYESSGCDAVSIKGIYIQITFFDDSEGAEKFILWVGDDPSVEWVTNIANKAYFFSENEEEGDCRVNIHSTTFRRNNVIARVRVRSMEGGPSDADMKALSFRIAQIIDEQIKSSDE